MNTDELDQKEYVKSIEAALVFYASVYEKCRMTYQDKYYKICSVGNPDRRDLTEFEMNILRSFPQIQGFINIRATTKIAGFKIERGLELKDIADKLDVKYSDKD